MLCLKAGGEGYGFGSAYGGGAGFSLAAAGGFGGGYSGVGAAAGSGCGTSYFSPLVGVALQQVKQEPESAGVGLAPDTPTADFFEKHSNAMYGYHSSDAVSISYSLLCF